MKKAAKIVLLIVLTLLLIWLSGRYCWQIFGFSLCESAGIEQVDVEDGHVRIRGFDPGSFPRGFLGCHTEQEGSTLYVGFKFSTLFGIFETGDFDVTLPTKGTVTQVTIRTSENEYPIWPKEEEEEPALPEEPELPDETEAAENGIYVRLECNDVYSIGWYFENESGGMMNADGTALETGSRFYMDNDIYFAAANLERPVPVTLVFSGQDEKVIAQAHLSFDPQTPVMDVVLTAEGRILVDGMEVEEPAVPTAYEEILDQYRTALDENWGGQQLVDAGMNFMILDVAPAEIGFAVDDLDDDGIPELAIGTLSGDEFYGKLIFDLYTLEDGQPVQVFSSIHRNRYYYAGGIRFANLGSSAADSSYVTTLKLENGELVDMTYTMDPADYVQMQLVPIWEEYI